MLKKSFLNILLIFFTVFSQFVHPQWKKINEVGKSSCILTFDDIVIVGTDNGIYRSTDEGESWTHFDLTSFNLTVTDLTKNDQYIFAGTYNGVYSSADTGKSWKRIGPDFTILSVFVIDSIILAGIHGGGKEWTWVEGSHFYSYIMDDGKIFAGTFDGIYTSIDSGFTWHGHSQNGRIVSSITRNEEYFFATLWDSLLRSDDFGLTWKKSDEGLPFQNHNIYSVFACDSLVFAGLTLNGVYLSKNNGMAWEKFDEGIEIFDTTYHVKFAINSSKVFVSFLYNSLWEYPLSSITGVREIDSQTIEHFNLFQNFPNPFNPITKISWQSPVGSQQILTVYDILGREVVTLVNKEMPAGNYEVEFPAEGLASGIYIYRLTVGDYVSTKKMVILKELGSTD
jgi:hypothetical protein